MLSTHSRSDGAAALRRPVGPRVSGALRAAYLHSRGAQRRGSIGLVTRQPSPSRLSPAASSRLRISRSTAVA